MFFHSSPVRPVILGEVVKVEQGVEYINDQVLNTPAIALSQAFKEIFLKANESYKKVVEALQNRDEETAAFCKKAGSSFTPNPAFSRGNPLFG